MSTDNFQFALEIARQASAANELKVLGQEFEGISAEFDGLTQHDQEGCVSIRLPHVSSGELIMFPETAEGYVSKVRPRSPQLWSLLHGTCVSWPCL